MKDSTGELKRQRSAGRNVLRLVEQPIRASEIELAREHQTHALESVDSLDVELSHGVAPETRGPRCHR